MLQIWTIKHTYKLIDTNTQTEDQKQNEERIKKNIQQKEKTKIEIRIYTTKIVIKAMPKFTQANIASKRVSGNVK